MTSKTEISATSKMNISAGVDSRRASNNDLESNEHKVNSEHKEGMTTNGGGATMSSLPPGYFTSPYIIGSWFATGMNLLAGTGGFALIAPVLTQINESIGPDPAIIWIALIYTLGLALGLTLVGRLSDIFGRRYFLIGGVSLGLLGSIVCATAKTVPVLIGGQTLIGLAASVGYSYPFTMGELVPMKYRFLVSSTFFPFTYITAGFGAAISTAFILHTNAGWRWSYYLLIILNAITLLVYILFYFPANFSMLHANQSKSQWIKRFDYIGTVLYIAGLTLFIMGLSWGGAGVYSWKDGRTIGTIVVGVVLLAALFAYESLVKLEEPLIPMHLFSNRGWIASALILALGASTYYGFAIVWPQMCNTIYNNGSLMHIGWISTLPGMAFTTGLFVGGQLAGVFGNTKIQVIVAFVVGTTLLGGLSVATPDTPNLAMVLVSLSSFAVGWGEVLVITICTIAIRDQQDVGVASGVAGSIRSAISTVFSTVYIVVLQTSSRSAVSDIVLPAIVAAGLPKESVESYFAAIASGTSASLQAVDGITPDIIAVGAREFKYAYASAYRDVYYAAIAVCSVATLLAFLVPNVDSLMTDSVAATLHAGKDEAVVGSHDREEKH